jgi:nitrogenase molybdenum-iron protein beta chain
MQDAPNAISTLLLQPWQFDKTKKLVQNTWKPRGAHLNIPMGLAWTDDFLMKVAELTGKPIPESLTTERGRLVDMMTDSACLAARQEVRALWRRRTSSSAWSSSSRMGAEPTHVVCHQATSAGRRRQKMLASSPVR